MDLHSRREYLMKLREDYLKATKKEKGRILNELIPAACGAGNLMVAERG